ncbi:hypothetical protein FB451DRAFT_1535427 [Mycena latifolia]|nr:hypothetical protein FB451DRAFT_1535427 [Mycena latifolia]
MHIRDSLLVTVLISINAFAAPVLNADPVFEHIVGRAIKRVFIGFHGTNSNTAAFRKEGAVLRPPAPTPPPSRITRNSDKARRAHAADSNVAALQAELLEMKEELTAARGDAKAEPSADTTQRVRELEATAVDLEGKLKLAKAEAKSSSSGRVRAPKAGVGATTSNVTAPTANHVGPGLGATAALPMPMSPHIRAESGSDVADVRRLSARKRTQADSSGTARVSSNKRQKKLEDPLAGWVMQDPDTGEKLTGHEWVERNPEEFAQRYKKDHQRCLQYLAQSVDS